MQFAYISFAILCFFALVQLYYHWRYFIRLGRYKDQAPEPGRHEPVSVIVVARNEYKNLEENLHHLLNQDYPDYEVIVVNNGSWDRSQELLEGMEEANPRLRIVKIVEQERYPKGKKFGLTLGIKAAHNEWLLLTDSDCQPDGPGWIRSMSRHFVQGTDIVLGYSPVVKRASLINLFARFDSFYTALQYLSFSLGGKTYMGVGRNLAYRKSLFFKVKGFASHNHILSGDDDLFVNETATASNTRVSLRRDSFVHTPAKNSWGEWIRQKRRHLSVGKHYSGKSKRILAGLSLSYGFFYMALAAALYFCWPFEGGDYIRFWPLGVYVLRLISQYLTYGLAASRLREQSLLYFLPLLDLFFVLFYFFMGLGAFFRRKPRHQW